MCVFVLRFNPFAPSEALIFQKIDLNNRTNLNTFTGNLIPYLTLVSYKFTALFCWPKLYTVEVHVFWFYAVFVPFDIKQSGRFLTTGREMGGQIEWLPMNHLDWKVNENHIDLFCLSPINYSKALFIN